MRRASGPDEDDQRSGGDAVGVEHGEDGTLARAESIVRRGMPDPTPSRSRSWSDSA